MRRFLLPLLAVCIAPSLHAQLQVDMEIKRRFLMLYEPIVVTVTVQNLAGRDITLTDSLSQSWFGFQITRGDGQLVPPLDPHYRLEPLTIPAGETVQRKLILNTLFPVHELGLYRVRAIIYFSAMEKYFQSQMINLEISEGRTIWQQTVGVPEGEEGAGGMRRHTLLLFRQFERTYLYARVEDVDGDVVYACSALGRILSGVDPDVQLDAKNNLHVLQLIAPKSHLYSCISVNGEVFNRANYTAPKERPVLRRTADGTVSVAGGYKQDPDKTKGPEANKLSDRPVKMPGM